MVHEHGKSVTRCELASILRCLAVGLLLSTAVRAQMPANNPPGAKPVTPQAEIRFTPVQIAFSPGLGLMPRAGTVGGLRLSMPWGRCDTLYGLDLGLYNETRHGVNGFELGLVNRMPDLVAPGQEATPEPAPCRWVQAAVLANWNNHVAMSGVQLAGLVNYNPELARCHGLQMALLMNANETDADRNEGASFRGIQIAGLVNRNRLSGASGGLQLAGLGNWNNGGTTFSGVQAAVILGNGGYISGLAQMMKSRDRTLDNVYPASVRGAQISVGAFAAFYVIFPPLFLASAWVIPNNTADNLDGLQASGLGVNDVLNRCDGVQVAGLVNLVRHSGAGLQVGSLNMVGWNDREALDPNAPPPGFFGDFEFAGAQAGIVNLSRGRFAGVQIGIVNVSDRLCGVQIGVVNWIQQGPVRCLPLLNAAF